MRKLLLLIKTVLLTSIISAQTVTELITNIERPTPVVDQNKDLYLVNNRNKEVYKVDEDGSLNLFVTVSEDILNLNFDPQGNLYIKKRNTILKISPDGETIEEFLVVPSLGDFIFDSTGILYYVEGTDLKKRLPNSSTSVFASGFIPSGVFGGSSIHDIHLDDEENVYVVENETNTVTKFDQQGNILETYQSFNTLRTVVGPNGNIYYAEDVDTGGIFITRQKVVRFDVLTKESEDFVTDEIETFVRKMVFDKNNVLYVLDNDGKIFKVEDRVLSTDVYEWNENISFVTPNPTTGIITLENDVRSIAIYDLQGKLVYENTKVIEETIDISNLTIGVYSVHLTDHNNQKSFTKLVKN